MAVQSLTFGKRKTFSPWKQKQKIILIVSMLLYFHILKYVRLIENDNFQLSTFWHYLLQMESTNILLKGRTYYLFIFAFLYVQKVIQTQHCKSCQNIKEKKKIQSTISKYKTTTPRVSLTCTVTFSAYIYVHKVDKKILNTEQIHSVNDIQCLWLNDLTLKIGMNCLLS